MNWFEKNWFNIIGTFLILFLISIYLYDNYGVFSGLKKYFKINYSECKMVKKEDTHGGPHGDGHLTAILDCSKYKQNIKNKKNCYPLPTDDEYVKKLIDNYKLYDAFQLNNELFDVDEIKNGYYCFYGRNMYDDYSSFKYYLNFDLAIYNSDNNYLYYCNYDV